MNNPTIKKCPNCGSGSGYFLKVYTTSHEYYTFDGRGRETSETGSGKENKTCHCEDCCVPIGLQVEGKLKLYKKWGEQ